MDFSDKIPLVAKVDATFIGGNALTERLLMKGRFRVELIGADGALKWVEEFDNTVVTVGQNLALDTLLAGSAYTVTGPYMGLISSVSYSAISAADTMTSHTGWLEAGNAHAPTYGSTRPTAVFSAAAAGAKALSSPLNFTFTGGGTVEGAFIVLGTGASATVDNTGGTLLSAGVFTTGARAVLTSDQLNVSYTLSG